MMGMIVNETPERIENRARAALLDRLEIEISLAIEAWGGSNRADRRRRQGLREALEIVRAARQRPLAEALAAHFDELAIQTAKASR